MPRLRFFVRPEHIYEKYKLLWDSIGNLLDIDISPPISGSAYGKTVQPTIKLANSFEPMEKQENGITLDNRLSEIDLPLGKNIYKNNSLLFEIVEFIREKQNFNTTSKACLVIDDPALHRFKYGYINFINMVTFCKKYGVKCCVATIPLDMWYYNSNLIEFLKENKETIGLCMHGVFHFKGEMKKKWAIDKCIPYINYGVNKIVRFEKKTGLRVSRMIVPPHGMLSYQMLEALWYARINGVVNSGKTHGLNLIMENNDVIAGTRAVNYAKDRVAVLLREPMNECIKGNAILKKRMSFRKNLNQHIIFSSHHKDFKNMESAIEGISDFAEMLGVKWATMQQIENDIYADVSNGCMKKEISPNKRCEKLGMSILPKALLRRSVCIIKDQLKI